MVNYQTNAKTSLFKVQLKDFHIQYFSSVRHFSPNMFLIFLQ